MNSIRIVTLICLALLFPSAIFAQNKVPPYDLWTDEVIAKIRDPKTLEISIQPQFGYADVFFTSNPSASFFDATAPYAEHNNEKIRIHGYLATPLAGGPHPALVIGHGHGGHADVSLAQQVALLGYVALYIDGPQAGLSTGGPKDDNQAWISVDKGPEYGYLYHYGYAGMRALTVLEELAGLPGNPYRIDPARLGALGASMGGIFTTYLNGIDNRMKVAIIMASAGSWAHTLRYANSWLYEGIYDGTRDKPYNGSDPLNSIEDVDRDPTAITFMNYFDPIRYAPRQYAPVLTLIGTHDEYFPLPNANLMLKAMTSAQQQPNFEKRLWLIPNAPHGFDSATDLLQVVTGLKQFMDFAVNGRARPLATPQVSVSDTGNGLRFEVTLDEPDARLNNASARVYAAMRIDSTRTPINDFKSYTATRQGDRFLAQLPAGEKTPSGDTFTADGVIFYATVTDAGGLPVSSLAHKGALPMDLSTDFTPVIEPHTPGVHVPLPPSPPDASEMIMSSVPVSVDQGYQGIALSNPTAAPNAVRVEARSADGRIAASEGLVNPVYLSLPPRTQQVFVAEEWMGAGARAFNGSLHATWTDTPAAALSFRGALNPTQLDEIGPMPALATSLWLTLGYELAGTKRIRVFGGPAAADVQVFFRNRSGEKIQSLQVQVPARGTVDLLPPAGSGALEPASAEIQASTPVSARMEVGQATDTWSISASQIPTGTRYYQPHTELNGNFSTNLIFLNPSGTSRRIVPHLHNTDGSEIGSATFFVLGGYATAIHQVESLFPVSNLGPGAGWLDFEAPDGPVIVNALVLSNRTGAAAASALNPGGSGTWSMPYYVEAFGYWTGLAIANVGSQASDLTITATDRSGSVLGQWQGKLEAGQSRTQLVYQWITGLSPGTNGQITVATSGPAALLAYFGTNDGTAAATIPFTLIASR